jgi:hypothetical protein
MRSTLRLLAVGAILAGAGAAAAASPAMQPPMTMGTPSGSTTSPATSSSSANPATSAGANTSATAGGFQVGEPVKDNTGATIGEIAALSPGANGGTMAVIKMGTDTFQVSTDRLGSADGAATINLTQAQIVNLVHGKSAAPPAPNGQ